MVDLLSNDQLLEYKKSIDKANVVSFDIFDTLFHRHVYKPWHLFHVVSKSLFNSTLAYTHPYIVTGFTSLRVSAESIAREFFRVNRGSSEVTLWDIYTIFGNMVGLQNEYLAEIIKRELMLERLFVYKDPIMAQVYEYAKQANKRVILCSDMYLPAVEIEQLLIAAGYQDSFEIYVSGELRKSKQHGDVFPYLFTALGVSPEEVVHFGDNPVADYLKAKEYGVNAYHLSYFEGIVNLQLRFPLHQSENASIAISLTQGINQYFLQVQKTDDFWIDIGRQVFGPLIFGHFVWLMNHLKSSSIEKVLFFARDGYLLEKLYKLYAGIFGVDIPSEYVYVSRASLFVPSFSDFDMRRMEYFYTGKAVFTVGQHLQKSGLSPYQYEYQIRQAGFSSINDQVVGKDYRLTKLLSMIYDELQTTSKFKGGLAKKYIGQVIESHRHIGIVEIGWSGTMQGSFSRIANTLSHRQELSGFYFGTYDTLIKNIKPNNQFYSYLFHLGEPKPIVDHFYVGAVELLEFILSAPHGTTLGYQQDENGLVFPILENNPGEVPIRELAMRVQTGIMEFFDKAISLLQPVGFEGLVTTDWADPFYRLVRNPSLEEANMLGEITHSEALGDTVKRIPIAMKLSEEDKMNRLQEYYQNTYWKPGFVKRNS